MDSGLGVGADSGSGVGADSGSGVDVASGWGVDVAFLPGDYSKALSVWHLCNSGRVAGPDSMKQKHVARSDWTE